MSSSTKKQSKKSSNTYMVRIRELHCGLGKIVDNLKGYELPYETEKRLLQLFNLSDSAKKDFLIGRSARAVESVLNSPSLSKLRFSIKDFEQFTSVHPTDCLEQFVREANYILALYFLILTRPLKDDFKRSAKRTAKLLSQHIGALYKHVVQAQKTADWGYISDVIDRAYKETKDERGERNRGHLTSAHFFATLSGMHQACKRMNTMIDEAVQIPKPRGKARENERRNRALIALASSYELCFDDEPTNAYDIGFDVCARTFLSRAGYIGREDGPDHLADDTVTDLIKDTICKYRTIKELHFQKWIRLLEE